MSSKFYISITSSILVKSAPRIVRNKIPKQTKEYRLIKDVNEDVHISSK